MPLATKLAYPDQRNPATPAETVRLTIKEVRPEDCNTKALREQREQVRRFLINLPWTKDETGDGINWLELLLLYKLHGWDQNDEVGSHIGEGKPAKEEFKKIKAAVRWNTTF